MIVATLGPCRCQRCGCSLWWAYVAGHRWTARWREADGFVHVCR